MRLRVFFITVFMLAYTCRANCQVSMLGDTLSFQDVIRVGLAKNFNIQLFNYSVESVKGQAMSAHGLLNPYLDVTANSNSGNNPEMTLGDAKSLDASFVVPSAYGIYYSAGFGLLRANQLNPTLLVNSAGEWAGLTIPLLRGLGNHSQVNTAILATNKYYAAKQVALSDEVIKYVRDLSLAYMELLKNLSIYDIRVEDDSEANEYKRYIDELITQNEIPSAESNRSESFKIEYDQKLLEAKNNVLNSLFAMDQLLGVGKNKLPRQIPLSLDSLPTPIQDPASGITDNILNHIDTLVKRTPYYQSLELASAGADIELLGAKNLLKNQLDLNMRYYHYGATINESEQQFGNTLSSTYPGSSFNVTLAYHLPIKNEQNKGNYINKLANYQSQNLLKDKIKFESENGIRNLLTTVKNLYGLYKYSRQYVNIQQKAYLNERVKFQLGSSNQLDIISAYESFAETRANSYELAYNIYYNILQLKYLIGDMPTQQSELEETGLRQLSMISLPEGY